MQGVLVGAVTVAIVLLGALLFQRSRLRLAQVKDSEVRFRLAMKHSAIGMVWLSPRGCWQGGNHALVFLMNYDEELLLGSSYQVITHPDDQLKSRSMLEDLLAGEIEGYSLEQRFIASGGESIWVRLSVSSVSAEGAVSYLVAQVENIHAAKLSEQAWQEMREVVEMALEVVGLGIWE